MKKPAKKRRPHKRPPSVRELLKEALALLTFQKRAIREVLSFLRPKPAAVILFYFDGRLGTILEMTNTQETTATLVIKNKKGGSARVDGPPSWSTDNSDVIEVTAAADGMSAKVKALGPLSDTPITGTVQADADLGDGVKPIVGTFVIPNVTAGEATTVEVKLGDFTEQE